MQLNQSKLKCQRVTVIVINSIMAVWAIVMICIVASSFHDDEVIYYFAPFGLEFFYLCCSAFTIVGSTKKYTACIITGCVISFVMAGISLGTVYFDLCNWSSYHHPNVSVLLELVKGALYMASAILCIQVARALRMERSALNMNSPYRFL